MNRRRLFELVAALFVTRTVVAPALAIQSPRLDQRQEKEQQALALYQGLIDKWKLDSDAIDMTLESWDGSTTYYISTESAVSVSILPKEREADLTGAEFYVVVVARDGRIVAVTDLGGGYARQQMFRRASLSVVIKSMRLRQAWRPAA